MKRAVDVGWTGRAANVGLTLTGRSAQLSPLPAWIVNRVEGFLFQVYVTRTRVQGLCTANVIEGFRVWVEGCTVYCSRRQI